MGKDFNDINEEIEIIEFPDVPNPETEFSIIDYPNDGFCDPIGDIVEINVCDPIGDIVEINDCDPIGDITSIVDYSIGETISDENSGLKEGYQEDFITDYRRLMDTVVFNQQEKEKWYIMLIFNPLNRTAAVDAFLNNYHYISERTKNIHYYIPGLKSLKGGFEETIRSNWSVFRLSKDTPIDMIFDRKGMLETVDWLEENCPSYSYREGIDLLLMKSCYDKGSRSLDVKNLIHLPLDQIHKRGGNVVDAITFVRGLVRRNVTLELARKEIDGYMERITGGCVRNFFKREFGIRTALKIESAA